jgi:two-component system, response regulator YesN
MKFKLNYFKNLKTFNKIFIFFIIIISLLIMPTLILCNYANNIIISKQIEANKNYLSSVTSYTNNIFLGLRNSCYDVMGSEYYNNYIKNFKKYERDFSIDSIKLMNSLKYIKINNQYVKNVTVFSHDAASGEDYLLTEEGTYNPETYFETINIREDYSYKFWLDIFKEQFSLKILPSTATHHTKYGSDDKTLTILVKEHYSKNPMTYMMVDINENSLYELIDSVNITKNGYVYILDGDKEAFINSADALGIKNEGNIQKILHIVKNNRSNSNISLGNKDFLMTYNSAGINNLYYIVITPKDILVKDMVAFVKRSIFIIFLFTAAGVLISLFFTKSIYVPLKNTINYVKSVSGDSDEVHDEYEFLKNSFSKMKVFEQNSTVTMMNIVIYRALNGILKKDEADKLIKEYKLPLDKKYFAILSIRVNNSEYSTELRSLLAGLGEFVEMSSGVYALLINLENIEEVKCSIDSVEKKIKIFLSGKENTSIFLGLSECFEDITLGSKFYYQAYSIFDMRNASVDKLIYTKDDCGIDSVDSNLGRDKKKISNIILNGDSDESIKAIEDMLDHIKTSNITFLRYRQTINELVFIALDVLNYKNIDHSSVFENLEVILYEINMEQSKEILEERCMYVYRKIIEFLKNQSESLSTTNLILDYIDKNIEVVCLNQVADRFNMNPNYLSQYFKKHTGSTFTNYVNLRKIEIAKERLANCNKTIDSIGRELGFSNASAFIRLFKQIEGITPNSYRENLVKDNL